ncbi:MAG: MFS transporter [Rhizobiales bacterium]|nr:MFS transporter [Hyphomicrobiales bacterium]
MEIHQSPFRWAILAGCWLLYFVFGLSVASLAPLVSEIQADLQISSSAMGTILGAWQFVYIFLAVPVGFALQRFGGSLLLVAAGAIVALSGIARANSETYTALLLSVALFGMGGPIISAGIPQTVSKWFDEKQRGLAMGVYITGPAVAGVLVYSSTQALLMPWFDNDWRSVLLVWAFLAFVATVIWVVIIVLTRNLDHSGDPLDQDLATAQSTISVVQLLLRQRNVVLLLMIGAGVLAIDHGMRNWLPEIIRSAGWSATASGHLSVIPVALGIVGALSLPRLATKERRPRVLQSLFGLSAAGCLLISVGHVLPLVLGLTCLGLASGALMTVTLLSLIGQNSVGPQNAGLAGGMFFSVAEIGGVAGPVLIGLVYDLFGGFQPALLLLASLSACLLVMAIFIRQEH